MKTRLNQQGFSVVEFVVILVIIAGLGFVGYTVYNPSGSKNTTTTSTQPANSEATAIDVPSALTISSTSDLDKAGATLDQTDVSDSNSSDSSQLDSQLAAF